MIRCAIRRSNRNCAARADRKKRRRLVARYRADAIALTWIGRPLRRAPRCGDWFALESVEHHRNFAPPVFSRLANAIVEESDAHR